MDPTSFYDPARFTLNTTIQLASASNETDEQKLIQLAHAIHGVKAAEATYLTAIPIIMIKFVIGCVEGVVDLIRAGGK